MEANPVDGRHWNRLATALFAAGDLREALAAYRKVREIGLHDDDTMAGRPGGTAYLIARCHAALGEHDQAIATLEAAMAEGFVEVDEAVADPRLAALRGDSRFDAVLGLEDVTGLDRTGGWRTDLRVLVREVKRRRPVPWPEGRAARLDHEADLLGQAVPDLTDAQVAAGMMRLLPLLDDGHAYLEAPSGDAALSRALPLQFYLFAEGVFVVSAEPAYAALLGARVLAFDGTPIEDVLHAVDAVICQDAANDYRSAELAADWLRKTPILHALGAVDDPAAVRLRTDAGEFAVDASAGNVRRVKHFPVSATMRQFHDPRTAPLYLRHADTPYWFEVLAEHRTMYCQINAIADDPEEPLAAFARRLVATIERHRLVRLVVDLRWNRGGNTFLAAPLLKCVLGCAAFDRPGGLVLVIGRRTFSAAGNFAQHLQWFAGPALTIIGEPSGSSARFIGETVPFDLPYSRLKCNISNLFWQGMTPLDRRGWIPPDIHLPPTFAAYSQNRDPVMDAALACR
ncbi:MAG TPA: hypothetical protein VGP26_03435 [Actinophytocola sp.]|nr:hypothetical protein [Actinophytocola sp.]